MRSVFLPVAVVILLFFTMPGIVLPASEVKSNQFQNERTESLIRALADEDAETRMKAAETLGDLRDTRAVLPLMRALRDSNLRVQINAALALGKIGDVQAIESLIEALLKNSVFYVREAAAKALGDLGDKRAVVPLFIAIGDSETAVGRAAGNSLKKLDEIEGYLLYEALYLSGPEAIKKIGNENIPRLFDIALKAFDQWDPNTRENVIWILGSMHNEHTIEFLISILSDPYSGVRTAAVWSLGKIGGKRTIAPLLSALDDPSAFVREAAALSLGETHDNSVVEPLINTLDDKNARVREAALWSLMKIGDNRAIQPAIDALGAPEAKIRIAAAWTVGALGDATAVSPLIRALNDYDEYVREAALWSIIKISGQDAAPLAIKGLEDRSPVVRSAAAQALGDIGNDDAIMPLIHTIADKKAEVREAAVSSLIRVDQSLGSAISEILEGNREALKALEIKKDRRFTVILVDALNSNISEIRYAAAWYLGEVREARAVENLAKMAKSCNLKDRFYGMVALSKLQIDGIDNNFSLALKILGSLSSFSYYLLIIFFFVGIISMIPVGRRNLHFLNRAAIACLVAAILISLPAFSLTWLYYAFLTIGVLILPVCFLCVMVPFIMLGRLRRLGFN
jgi:HEAT repeat protein